MSTSKPATREEFKQFCLRRLGAPLLEINIDDDQTEDCIEIAFQYYYDYHYDATEKVFLAHAVTQDDKTNKYITVPDAIIGVMNIFDIGDSYSTNNLFNLRYQISLNVFVTWLTILTTMQFSSASFKLAILCKSISNSSILNCGISLI